MKWLFIFLIILAGCAVEIDTDGLETISRAEIANNKNEESCWVAYKGLVYDLTEWLEVHPGTGDAILPDCGTVEEFESSYIERHGNVSNLRINEPIGVLE